MLIFMTFIRFSVILLSILAYPLLSQAAPSSQAVVADDDIAVHSGLAPHRALYRLNMIGKRSESQIINVRGKMLYEWKSDCNAWLSDHRLDVSYDYTDTPPVRIRSDFSTYETFDGKSMNFSSQKHRDGILFKEVRGYATLNGEGKAIYSVPEDTEFDLSEGTLFPMGHTLQVLREIEEGNRFYKATVYDGSDDLGPVEINTFVGPAISPESLDYFGDDLNQDLLKSPARRVRLAFFSTQDEQASLPEYEMSVILHENGVISDMVVEYEDFTVEQKLIALETQDIACTDDIKLPK